MPDGDLLIHAGDFTNYGKKEHIIDFNSWLGELPHKHKVVVNGNHENNAMWKSETRNLLSNATFLNQESYSLQRSDGTLVTIFGTEFSWPLLHGSHPNYSQIPEDTNILICHGPAKGQVDGGHGCPSLLRRCEDLRRNGRLKFVVSGHIHGAHGQCVGSGTVKGVKFVNASICGNARKAEHEATVIYY